MTDSKPDDLSPELRAAVKRDVREIYIATGGWAETHAVLEEWAHRVQRAEAERDEAMKALSIIGEQRDEARRDAEGLRDEAVGLGGMSFFPFSWERYPAEGAGLQRGPMGPGDIVGVGHQFAPPSAAAPLPSWPSGADLARCGWPCSPLTPAMIAGRLGAIRAESNALAAKVDALCDLALALATLHSHNLHTSDTPAVVVDGIRELAEKVRAK